MSTRPLRPCATPGCPALVARGHCPDHTRERKKDPHQARFYGSTQWQTLRRLVKMRHPICTECRRAMATQVHHVDGNWRNNALENLTGICGPCHATLSARQHNAKRDGTGGEV